MWDSVLKLGRSLSFSFWQVGRKEGPAFSPGCPVANLPQLTVRLSSAQRLASVCHLTCFFPCPSFPAPCMAEVERVEAGVGRWGGAASPCSRLLLTAGGQT